MKKIPRTGVIRDYDMHSTSVKIGYGIVIFLCCLIVVVAIFPLIWVVLAGFKDLTEFTNSGRIFP